MQEIYTQYTENIFGNESWANLFMLAVLVIVIARKRMMRRGWRYFFPYLVLVGVVIWLPLFIDNVRVHFFKGITEMARISVALFWTPVLAYVLTNFFYSVHDLKRKSIILACITVIIIGEWYPLNAHMTWDYPQNIYKVPNATLTFDDIMHYEKGKEEKISCLFFVLDFDGPWASNDFFLGGRVYYGLTQYDANIELMGYSLDRSQYEDKAFDLSNIKIGEKKLLDFDFLICPHQSILQQKLERIGFVLESDIDGVCLYTTPGK